MLTAVSLEDARMMKNLHRDIYLMVLPLWYSFKWQYMAGAGAVAAIMDKGGAGAEGQSPDFTARVF